jgi:hypothetical protein
MRVFKSKTFARFSERNAIPNEDLCDAVRRASRGLIDANLGGGVLKQRLAREGGGRSGGFRAIVFFRSGDRAVFAHGFAKKDRGNITQKESGALKKLAKIMLGFSGAEISTAVAAGVLVEVTCDGETIS